MGEIRTKVLLENDSDTMRAAKRKLAKRRVRRVQTEAIVDTGAVMLLLPEEIVDRLGLERFDKMTVVLADDRKLALDCAGSLRLWIGDRQMVTDCLVGPPGCATLLGQLVLERLDLIPDPKGRTLTPRPESPLRPTLGLRRSLHHLAQQNPGLLVVGV